MPSVMKSAASPCHKMLSQKGEQQKTYNSLFPPTTPTSSPRGCETAGSFREGRGRVQGGGRGRVSGSGTRKDFSF